MLALPTVGIARSIKKHNIELPILCDWIEASVLFEDEELSASDVVDVLIENNIYEEQDFAWEMLQTALNELVQRQNWLGKGAPIKVDKDRISRLGNWNDFPAIGFCLALSYAKWYPAWAKQFGSDYTEQGELFEAIAKESLEEIFPGWTVYQTGWTTTRTSNLYQVAKKIASLLNEAVGDVEHWTEPAAHEAGLDILCYRSFQDGRVGVPVFLIQCASGGDWKDKLHTPDVDLWMKLVQFAVRPKKAFVMPYSLEDREFRNSCVLVQGMFLDRYRLLSAGRTGADWLSAELRTRLIIWLDTRVNGLPYSNS